MNDKDLSTDIQVNDGNGKITFANEVVAIIAGLAATEVQGIAGMSGGLVGGIAEMLGRKNLSKGVKVEVTEEEVTVELYLIVNYGVKIHEVCAEIQQSVKNAIETMTGLTVLEVNVFVQGVHIEKEVKEAAEPSA